MDPEAAQIVLDAGVRPVLVGLDVCHRTHLAPAQLADTAFDTELGAVRRSTRARLGFPTPALTTARTSTTRSPSPPRSEPELLTLEPAFVHVEPAAGTSVAWLPDRPSAWSRPARRDNALVATDVDVDAFAALFAERVLAQLDRSSASSRTSPGPSNT